MWVLQQHHFISLSSKLMIRESNGLRQKGRRKSSSQKIEWADESEELFPLQMIPVTLFLRCLEDICCSLHSQPQKNLFIFYHFLLHRKLTYLIDNLMDNFFNQYEEVIQDPGLKANTHTHTHTHQPWTCWTHVHQPDTQLKIYHIVDHIFWSTHTDMLSQCYWHTFLCSYPELQVFLFCFFLNKSWMVPSW